MEYNNKLKPKKPSYHITTSSLRNYKHAFQYQDGHSFGVKGETNYTIDPKRVSVKANKAYGGLYALLVDGKPIGFLDYPRVSEAGRLISNYYFHPEEYKDLTKLMEEYNAYDRDRYNKDEPEGYWFDI